MVFWEITNAKWKRVVMIDQTVKYLEQGFND